MFCVIPLLLFVSNALAVSTVNKPYYDLADAENHFADFIQKYGKYYKSDEEYNKRFEIFKEALKSINEMNANQDAIFGVNEFSDVTREEFKRTYLGFVPSKFTRRSDSDNDMIQVKQEWIDEAPASLDYREQNLVTKVKQQFSCGACFVFSAIGNIEGQYAKKHKQLVSLSEQEGLDCDKVPTENCDAGGNSINIMKTLAQIGGSEREEDYPYSGYKQACRADKSKIVAKVTGGHLINTTTEEELKGAVSHFGPLSISLYYPFNQSYVGGVWSPVNCNDEADHAVVLVGYGTDTASGKDYWLIKNSWGERYGDKGYFRLERGKGLCRIGKEDTATADVE